VSGGELRFAHRQAHMVTAPGQNTFELAALIPELSGVQLQMIWNGEDRSNPGVARVYKQQAERSGILVPSVAGIWKPGETIFDLPVAEAALTSSIRMAEFFAATVILVALFAPNCPDMNDEQSFTPIVGLLQKLALRATEYGVIFALETSLSPADELKLLRLINRPGIRSYYDPKNVEGYHPGQSISGIETLDHHIVEFHLKNEDRLLQESSPVDWPAALSAFQRLRYNGWYVFETEHVSAERCIQDTQTNINFIKAQLGWHTAVDLRAQNL
jgi:sugar phosphate isomerase/epimerase